jgi:broad specificity phosphatase PhoE
MRKIYLIRHAESEANTGKFFYDPATIPITNKGLQQAIDLANRINKVSKLYHSKFTRTLQTAKPTIDKLKIENVEVHPHIHEFTYLHPDQFMNPDLSDEEKDS